MTVIVYSQNFRTTMLKICNTFPRIPHIERKHTQGHSQNEISSVYQIQVSRKHRFLHVLDVIEPIFRDNNMLNECMVFDFETLI